jgi:serine/threonine protein phosphatase PrpC
MGVQIIMDHAGDTRHYFSTDDVQALSTAHERFQLLIRRGFTAAVRDANGQAKVVRSFDSSAEETLFYPRLIGG